jgi:maltose/moltooligosaccharide transporter
VAAHDAPAEPTTGHGKTNLPRLLHIYLAHAFTWLGVQTMFVFMFAYAQQALFPGVADLDDGQKTSLGQVIAISFLIMNIVGFVLPVAVLQPLAKKIGLVRTHILCIFIMAAGYAGIIFFGQTSTALYALMAVVGIGWAAVVSLPFAIMSDSVDKARMGTFMGIFNLSVVIPQIIVSVLIGKMIGGAADKSITFIVCAISLAISAVLWALLKEDKTEPGEIAMGGAGH